MRPAQSSLLSLRRVAAALAVLAALLVAGCGGSDGGGGSDERDVEALLDKAFRSSIASADLKINAQLELDGLKGLDSPVRLDASGPFVAAKGTLPKLDLDVSVGAKDAGQAIETGVLSTGERAFVKFGGQFYEQPRADVDRANARLREEGGRGTSLRELGLDPRKWVIDARHEGEERIAGVVTDHLSAKLDVRALLADLNRLGGGASLSADQLDRMAEAVDRPRFDVYAGQEDSLIRRMSTNLEFEVPEDQREAFAGVERGSLRISVELSDVNGDQRVQAPSRARPISDLAAQLGGLGALERGGRARLAGGRRARRVRATTSRRCPTP